MTTRRIFAPPLDAPVQRTAEVETRGRDKLPPPPAHPSKKGLLNVPVRRSISVEPVEGNELVEEPSTLDATALETPLPPPSRTTPKLPRTQEAATKPIPNKPPTRIIVPSEEPASANDGAASEDEDDPLNLPGGMKWPANGEMDEIGLLRRKMEDEEIERFLNGFNKHAQHFRVHPTSRKSASPSDGAPTPAKPTIKTHEPFSIDRLRSNGERLYVASAAVWSGLGEAVGKGLMWHDRGTSACWASVYVLLTVTSTFTPFFCLLPIYYLLRNRFLPPSISHLLSDRQSLISRHQAAQDVLSALPAPDTPEAEAETVAARLAGMAAETVLTGGVETGRERKERRRLRRRWEEWSAEYGSGAVVVLGDLADMHEKLHNLYTWKSPSSARNFIIIMLLSALISHYTPGIILLKVFQVIVGIVLWVVVPLVTRIEGNYEAMAWLMGGAPTNTEYALELLRARAAAGIPLITPTPTRSQSLMTPVTDVPSTSLRSADTDSLLSSDAPGSGASTPTTQGKKKVDWGAVEQRASAAANTGYQWLEMGRAIARKEKGVGFRADSPSSATTESSDASEFRLGVKGTGMSLVTNVTAVDGGPGLTVSTPFLAQHRTRPGSLFISPLGIRFAYLVKPSTKPAAPAAEGGSSPPLTGIDTSRDFEVAMQDIVAVKKLKSATMYLIAGGGLSVETVTGQVLDFPFVANRQHAFNLLLASSTHAFQKI